MIREMKAKFKPLSFDTTLRNPERIAGFLKCLAEFEGQTLTNEVIYKVIKSIIRNKLYKPTFVSKDPTFISIYISDDTFTDSQLDMIIENSPQKHKEAGYDYGWPSRFETWFNLPKEYGLVWYKMGETIEISGTGHMLIDAINETPINNRKIQNTFLNLMCKYQSANPFRKTLVDNVPFMMLLKVIKRFKDEDPESTGIFRQELSFFICWPNNNDEGLYKFIKDFRSTYKFGQYTEEIIYEECLKLLGYGEEGKNYIKINKITGETIDEYIRKMKITGIISLRGNGRFLDFNTLLSDKIEYVLNAYKTYSRFDDEKAYYQFMSTIDNQLFDIAETTPLPEIETLKKTKLKEFAAAYSKEYIYNELSVLNSKKESKDPVLKFISRPARLEFLTSICLAQHFTELDINPSYPIDDEGLPTSTAGGNIADIICKDVINDELIEVTLMTGKMEQVNNEMFSITRHQKEARRINPNTYSVFIAPIIHEDVKLYIDWIKFKDDIDIKSFTINDFTKTVSISSSLDQIVMS